MSEVKVNKISPRSGTNVELGDTGDTVTVAGNIVKTNAIQASDGGNIVNQCGTTITLGAAGDTITLASGASQTGFGRTGTVDWETTKKTADFTAVNGEGYFIDTSSGAVIMTLPSSPAAGSIVSFKDYANTFDTNNLTINRNGSNIGGNAGNAVISVEGQSGTLVYVDSTKGWMIVNASTDADLPAPTFISASGGNATLTCGDFKTHVFTGPGTFTVSSIGNSAGSTTVEYLVVAGGGGGGKTASGGGGAGGVRENYPSPISGGLPVSAQAYPITVGGGGAGSCTPGNANGSGGSNSIFSTITSTGGGGGASGSGPGTGGTAQAGGSGGGGAGGISNSPSAPGGAGNSPPVSPPQGNPGGTTATPAGPPVFGGSGGGGAGAAGGAGSTSVSGKGGDGIPLAADFFSGGAPSYGTPGPAPGRYFGGGGGGSGDANSPPGAAGGAGGGGQGGIAFVQNTGTGTANTGGGSGGTDYTCSGKNAGSGVVMIRYKFQ